MPDFEKSRWSNSSFVQEYRNNADGYVPERERLIEITQSLYRHMVKKPCRMLDLGCGNGLMVQCVSQVDDAIDATLVDGSQEMLKAAGDRLTRLEKKHMVRASFQELLTQDPLQGTFGFVLSSLAIHHLSMAEKEHLRLGYLSEAQAEYIVIWIFSELC